MCAAQDIPRPLLSKKLELLQRRDNLSELLGTTGVRLPNNTWSKGTGAANEVRRLTYLINTWSISEDGRKQLMQQAKDAGIDWQDYKDNWTLKNTRQLEAAREAQADYKKRLSKAEDALTDFDKANPGIAALSKTDIQNMLMGGNEDNSDLPTTQHATADATQQEGDDSVENFLDTAV